MTPSYLATEHSGALRRKSRRALALLNPCKLCPRECGVNRLADERGFCNTGRKARVASFHAHFGEEAPLVGAHGSGTIFFSGCNLLCLFCQNFDISHEEAGLEVEPEQLAAMMVRLARAGCHNINFVTPTHVVPQILESLPAAIEKGLAVPLVYNSGGYDKADTLKLIDGVFDIYMPDFKFWEGRWSEHYCRAPDYRDRACEAVLEMQRQVGDLALDENGIAMRGLLIRHLVMPGGLAGTAEVMRFIADKVSRNAYVNVMAQYRPCGTAPRDSMAGRPITAAEHGEALELARRAGIVRLDNPWA